MKRFLILTYSAFLIIISYISGHMPRHEINSFMTAGLGWDEWRIGIAITLLLYALTRYFRIWPVRIVIGAMAILMLAVGLTGIVDDNFLGKYPIFLNPIDIFVLIEGGIIALMASLDFVKKPDIVLVPQAAPVPAPEYTISLFFLGQEPRPPMRATTLPFPPPLVFGGGAAAQAA